jgi:hypothetical protein
VTGLSDRGGGFVFHWPRGRFPNIENGCCFSCVLTSQPIRFVNVRAGGLPPRVNLIGTFCSPTLAMHYYVRDAIIFTTLNRKSCRCNLIGLSLQYVLSYGA